MQLNRLAIALAKRIVPKQLRDTIRRGLSPTRNNEGRGYIDANTTIAAAASQGVSICEYLENREPDTRKRGRRDRIIAQVFANSNLSTASHVIEIGTGTGMYLDSVIESAKCRCYEIYETAFDWRKYLTERSRLWTLKAVIHDADGYSLHQSRDGCADFVHAHGVLVYTSTVQSIGYIMEMARVCRSGGFVVFDCYRDDSWSLEVSQAWMSAGLRFPVVLPSSLLNEVYSHVGLKVVHRFQEIHGASVVDYEVLSKV